MTLAQDPKLTSMLQDLTSLDHHTINSLYILETQGLKDFLSKQIKKFLERGPEAYQECEATFARNDWPAARETIHKLIGWAGMIGATHLRLAGQALEATIDRKEIPSSEQLSQFNRAWLQTNGDFQKLVARLLQRN